MIKPLLHRMLSPLSFEVFVKLVVLVAFLDVPGWETPQDLDLVEFFSGKARTSKMANWMGFHSRAYDIEYHPTRHLFEPKHGFRPRSCMDINGPAGFAFLCLEHVIFHVSMLQLLLVKEGVPQHRGTMNTSQPISPYTLRLAIALCLQCRYQEALAVIAVVCSSWSVVNLATSQRDMLCPFGQTQLASVRSGNRMVARRGLK